MPFAVNVNATLPQCLPVVVTNYNVHFHSTYSISTPESWPPLHPKFLVDFGIHTLERLSKVLHVQWVSLVNCVADLARLYMFYIDLWHQTKGEFHRFYTQNSVSECYPACENSCVLSSAALEVLSKVSSSKFPWWCHVNAVCWNVGFSVFGARDYQGISTSAASALFESLWGQKTD